jgi:hypothetical protein
MRGHHLPKRLSSYEQIKVDTQSLLLSSPEPLTLNNKGTDMGLVEWLKW